MLGVQTGAAVHLPKRSEFFTYVHLFERFSEEAVAELRKTPGGYKHQLSSTTVVQGAFREMVISVLNCPAIILLRRATGSLLTCFMKSDRTLYKQVWT